MTKENTIDFSHLWLALIAGGDGTRLWPISNMNCPKQFCQLPTGETFSQATVERFMKLGVKPNHIMVITTNDHQRALAIEQLTPMKVISPNILNIPNTYGYAGSMYVAADEIYKVDPGAVIINSPADAYIDQNVGFDNFIQTMKDAINSATIDCRPTLVGVKISDLTTFIGCGHALYSADDEGICKVVHGFVEKPDPERAKKMMMQDESVCNTGINVWKARTILNTVGDFEFDKKQLSTDKLMEKFGNNLRVAVGNFVWRDCGTLKSLWEITGDLRTPHHLNANLGGGYIDRTDCRRSLFYTPPGIDLYVTGIEDASVIVVPYAEDVVFVSVVAHDECQLVKKLAERFMSNIEILTNDYTIKARNFTVSNSNCSDIIRAGCVGKDDIHVDSLKQPNGKMIISVSKKTRKVEKAA